MRVRVDRNLCVGAANCTSLVPMVFQLDDEMRAVVLKAPTADEEEAVWDAARVCPVNAIMLEDDAGNQLYP